MNNNEKNTVGKYHQYPDLTNKRAAEGGIRINDILKKSTPNIPLVTIITVCFNSGKTLRQCIQSVLNQTYTNIEYIIIDGLSKDNTLDIIKSNKNNIDYFISEPDRNLYHAMNKGIALASGEFILILNSDDWYTPDCVETLIKAIKYSNCSFVSALAQYVDDKSNPVELMRTMPFDSSVRLRMPLRHETMLIPAKIYNDVGNYSEQYKIIADFHLTTQIFEQNYSHYEVPRPLMYFRNTGVSSTDLTNLFKERIKLVGDKFSFLTTQEQSLFGNLGKLTAINIENLAKKYHLKTNFIHTLKDYFEDRKKISQVHAWKDYQINWNAIYPKEIPLVSVILPIYNAEDTLSKAIDSILAQGIQNIELICINDQSPDQSEQIIKKYLNKDKRIVYLKNTINIGLGASRNKGIRHSKGRYIFHIDPDDTIPLNALETLCNIALTHHSDMVKGAYTHEQILMGNAQQKVRRSLINGKANKINQSLKTMPELLRETEGHWSYLYSRRIAKLVPYPEDLTMGQDSIFLISVLIKATKISIIDNVVYHYKNNPKSAMNTFNFQKYMDALEWRRRAWHMLNNAKMPSIGHKFLQSYWSELFFSKLFKDSNSKQIETFFLFFRQAFSEANITSLKYNPPGILSKLFLQILSKEKGINFNTKQNDNLRIATFCSMDHGGAGTGTQRRVKALRELNVDVKIYSLVVKSNKPYVHRLKPKGNNITDMKVWQKVRKNAVLPIKNLEGFKATEFFSLTPAVLRWNDLKHIIDGVDVLHLHWVVGMFDYTKIPSFLVNKPIVWTLADMNAFTGGCHFSEGCSNFIHECEQCPLLSGKSDVPHKTWKIKQKAYQQLKNLTIICPSQWMAKQAKKSSLFKNRQIQVIPNAFPINTLYPSNHLVARIKLGLPLNKKLILFGADSATNYRKGGDLLKEIMSTYCQKYHCKNIEVVIFGNNTLELNVPVHHLGYIDNEQKLSFAYSACDVFVFPSREDNAPLTVGESLLCGTPVVSFPVGNIPELISHKKNGYIAEYLNCSDMTDGILWALHAPKKVNKVKYITKLRLSATMYHEPNLAANRHIQLYNKILVK